MLEYNSISDLCHIDCDQNECMGQCLGTKEIENLNPGDLVMIDPNCIGMWVVLSTLVHLQ